MGIPVSSLLSTVAAVLGLCWTSAITLALSWGPRASLSCLGPWWSSRRSPGLLPLQREGARDGGDGPGLLLASPQDSWYSHNKVPGTRTHCPCERIQTVLRTPPLTQQGGDNSTGLQGPSPQMPPSPSYLKQSRLSLRNVTITVENQNKKAM